MAEKQKASRIAVYPGVFDPPTNGHLDIIRRGAKLFDRLIVAVAENPDKQTLFTLAERISLLTEASRPGGAGDIPQVQVESYTGLTVDFVRRMGASAILRGIRTVADLDYEWRLALTNRAISGIETVFVLADERLAYISATLVKEIAGLKGNISPMVPPNVLQAIAKKLGRSYKGTKFTRRPCGGAQSD